MNKDIIGASGNDLEIESQIDSWVPPRSSLLLNADDSNDRVH